MDEDKKEDPKIGNDRFEICKKCNLLSEKEFCEKCGCYMPVKTKLPFMKCPEGKW